MSKHYTQEEIEEIRLAFEGTHGQGLINEIVWSEYDKKRSGEINAQELAEFFIQFSCDGVARFIHTVNVPSEKGLFECGSHCIDFYGVTKGAFSFQNATSFVGLMIGSHKRQVTPLEWLSYLSRDFERLSKIQRSGFNDVCNDMAKLNEAIAADRVIRRMGLEEFFGLS